MLLSPKKDLIFWFYVVKFQLPILRHTSQLFNVTLVLHGFISNLILTFMYLILSHISSVNCAGDKAVGGELIGQI